MKKIYRKPTIDIAPVNIPAILDDPSIQFVGTGGGNNAEAKVTHTFQFDDDIDELDDSSDSSEWCYVDYSNITFN